MAQEDHHSQRHNSNSSNGVYDHQRISKKFKQKKLPQRGLGVAQLEKIRLEEIQKKDVVVSSSSSTMLPPTNSLIMSPSNSSNCLAYRPTTISPSPFIPFPPAPCPNNPSLIQNIDGLNPGGGEFGWLMGGGRGGSWRPKLRNDEFDNMIEEENHGGGGFSFMKNVRLPYESNNSTWPQQRSLQFQQPCSSSMVNVSTGTSSPLSASALNFQVEPPSNQSYSGNNNFTPPLWPEEEKMVGMKRSYPMYLDEVPIPEFHCNLPPSSFVSPISRADESASCGNGGTTTNFEPSSYPIVIREGPSNSSASAVSEPKSKKVVQENLNGDFLRLAPPETHDSSSTRQNLQLSTKLSLQCQQGVVSQSVETLPSQGMKDSRVHLSGQDGLLKQQTFINFIPPAKTEDTGQATSLGSNIKNNGDSGEYVDLNLKL